MTKLVKDIKQLILLAIIRHWRHNHIKRTESEDQHNLEVEKIDKIIISRLKNMDSPRVSTIKKMLYNQALINSMNSIDNIILDYICYGDEILTKYKNLLLVLVSESQVELACNFLSSIIDAIEKETFTW